MSIVGGGGGFECNTLWSMVFKHLSIEPITAKPTSETSSKH